MAKKDLEQRMVYVVVYGPDPDLNFATTDNTVKDYENDPNCPGDYSVCEMTLPEFFAAYPHNHPLRQDINVTRKLRVLKNLR